jgi:alkanesulfonate monooxygenase SsuD/methylene tetrahydromethanopterin reductase-like flavin-dependent oxidoreductase (luciferase family)
VKNIGFLSFGHWSDSPHSQVRSAADALLQSVELAVAAEEVGADGAYFRVHHFAQQLASRCWRRPQPAPAGSIWAPR